MKTAFSVAACCLCLVIPLRAEDWPQWRGPRLDGTSTEKNLPLRWTTTENVVWRTSLPGIGHSSPIVCGDRVFVTTCLVEQKAPEKARVLLCLDRRDGTVLWQREVFAAPLEPKHNLNSWSSSTPATDGTRVFVSFLRLRPMTEEDAKVDPRIRNGEMVPAWKTMVPEMIVAAYDYHGAKLWETSPGRFYSRHGFCSSPILYNGLVIVNGDQDATAYIVALDGATGAERWRIDRPNRMRSYCVPLIVQAGGKVQMVLTGSIGVDSYDPATGKHLWHIDGPTEQYVASPVYGAGLFFMTAGFPTYHNWTVRPDGVGNVTKTHIVWHESKTSSQKAAYVPSPLAVDDLYYMISDTGNLSVFEAKTGKRLFMEKLGDHHSSSPVLADGHVYLPDDSGTVHVVKAGRRFEVVSQNPLGDKCYSSPAVSGGRLYFRTNKSLVCVGHAGRPRLE